MTPTTKYMNNNFGRDMIATIASQQEDYSPAKHSDIDIET
jgi:hypothetical protein